jgi:peptidoglycan/xylan/chitin deacetylase (PgdA/CDA1 family)
MRALYHPVSWTGADLLVWHLGSRRLRILCYHGVCEDRLASESWMPPEFVTLSVFQQQLSFLGRHGTVLPLEEAVRRLGDHSLPANSVCLTFDDGYANNLDIAYPELRRRGMPATVFLATKYIETGELFPFVKLRIVGRHQLSRKAPPLVDLPPYKSTPADVINRRLEGVWPEAEAHLSGDARRALRPMTVQEVRSADRSVLRFGAHTDVHCILSNETPERRASEIRLSIAKVAGWTGTACRTFSYPNGGRDDFGEMDAKVLRDEGIEAAVTGIAGANTHKIDPLSLRRYPIGLYHVPSVFTAEITGVRSTMLSLTRRAAL